MNKTALVTGGSSNIGQGIAIVLAEHGYDVAITYANRLEGALETKRQIEALGRKCFYYEAHLEKPEEPERIVNMAHKDLGRLDVMVCNAGRDTRNSILTTTAEDLDFLYTNNYRNYMLCSAAASRHMVADKIAGSIIFITSSRAEQAYPDDFIYGSFKAAMKRACESLALDLSAYNIRVNCVAPGATWPDTPRLAKAKASNFVKNSIPLHRVGNPRENGEAVAYLCSEAASYITGITIRVDGGLILPGMMEGAEETVWVRDEWKQQQYDKAMEMLKASTQEEN